MGFKKYFQQEYKKSGMFHALKATTIKTVKKLSGALECEKEIDTLYYYLNQYVDITKVPKATGDLRDLQCADEILLGIFHKICGKNHLRYWLHKGTLLGAVRHKGFIPWDDDVDVIMPREDYNKAKTVLRDEMKKYGIDAYEREDEPMRRIGVGYRHKETGVWIDVFPIDCFRTDSGLEETEKTFCDKVIRYRKAYKRKKKKLSLAELEKMKKDMFREYKKGEKMFWCFAPEFEEDDITLYDSEDVFPLVKHSFEGMELYVPRHAERILKREYGDTYFEFPRTGLEHHGSDSAKLSEWARESHTDMKEICRQLREIYDSIIVD